MMGFIEMTTNSLIQELEELASHLPWGTIDRGNTPIFESGNRLPYGIETILKAISELKKYEELKDRINAGLLTEAFFIKIDEVPGTTWYNVCKLDKSHYLITDQCTTQEEAEKKLAELENTNLTINNEKKRKVVFYKEDE